MEPTSIGKYSVCGELGRGAMGVVYKGIDPHIGRQVAIKTIRFDAITAATEQAELQQRFMREARSAGNLSHPSIVTIYEVGEDNGLTYIAMEYIDGESLESMVARRSRPPLEQLVDLIAQIADALDYAHRRGIVHRDIKPANVLVDSDGRPRIVDFGIARIASSSLTQTSMVLGTPAYMAPEQIAGAQVDHRADLFSLGAILYELLTFTRAFPGDNVTTVIYRIMNEMPPPPRVIDGSLPAGLDMVMAVALAKDPSQRYQSGRDLAADLRRRLSEDAPAADGAAAPQAATMAMRVPVQTAPGNTTADFPGLTASIPGSALEPSGAERLPSVSGPERTPLPAAVPEPVPASSRRTALLVVTAAMMLVVAAVAVALVFTWRSIPAPAGPGGGAMPAAPAAPETPPDPTALPPPSAEAQRAQDSPALPAKSRPASPPPAGAQSPRRSAAVPTAPPASRGGGAATSEAPALGARPSETPVPAPAGRVFEMADVDERPRVVRQVPPVYPADALSERLEDVVVLKALVIEDGRVAGVQLLRRSQKSPAFEAAAIAAVRQWEFTPARRRGVPVACWFNVGVPFQLPR